MFIECKNPESVVKRAFFLAWHACGHPLGMGFFQDKPDSDEESVWANVRSRGDYAYRPEASKPGDAYGDYVFGRMMKLGIKWKENGVEVRDGAPRSDYQAWCRKYSSYQELIEAAIKNLESS